jgi:hypothetical protein
MWAAIGERMMRGKNVQYHGNDSIAGETDFREGRARLCHSLTI